VSGGAGLEHGYRRWLRWYPASFRREHEAEMLAVLMAGARAGRRRPAPVECLDLVRGGLTVRLRPRVPRADRCAYRLVGLLYVGAVAELAVAVTVLATMGDIRSAILARDPRYTAAQWHAEVLGALVPLVVTAVLAVGFWAWAAWTTGRGHRRARLPFAAFFGLNTYGLINGLAEGSATYAGPALVAAVALWCVQVAVVVLMVRTGLRAPRAARPAGSVRR
jgi:hypothetical protein